MDEAQWGIVDILGPAVLLVLLIWLVLRSRRAKGRATDTTPETERGTDNLYRDEEQRRRDGTDDL